MLGVKSSMQRRSRERRDRFQLKVASASAIALLSATSSRASVTKFYYYDPVSRLGGSTATVGQDHQYQYDAADSRSSFYAVVQASPTSQTLQSGQTLLQEQGMNSSTGNHLLTLQDDSNLVLYSISNGNYTPIWAAPNTQYKQGARLQMQGDGNLVFYSSQGVALWSTGTAGNPGAVLAVQDDGNLVIYTAGGTPIWASNTSGR